MRLETRQELYSELQYFRLQPAVLRERIREVINLEQTLAQGLATAQTQRARQTVLRAFQAGLKRLDEDIDRDATGDPPNTKAA
jgi:DNA-binding NtrC family response regulator